MKIKKEILNTQIFIFVALTLTYVILMLTQPLAWKLIFTGLFSFNYYLLARWIWNKELILDFKIIKKNW